MTPSRILLIALLSAASWIMFLDRAAISTAKQPIAAALSLSDKQMGLAFGAFALGYALAQIPAGWFADRFGPRAALTLIVAGWSLLTALTGAVQGFVSLVAVRFAFGAAEAGAFPSSARAFYNWLPASLHGRANGLTFAAARLGAALAFPLLQAMLGWFNWRVSFFLLAVPGLIWAVIWFALFRDHPRDFQPEAPPLAEPLSQRLVSRPMIGAMAQYFASNFTFFLALTWMNPYLVDHYRVKPETAAWYLTGILLIGATAHTISGFLVDALHRSRWQSWSRRGPAVAGFLICSVALLLLTRADSVTVAVALFTAATFGAEMTISPSWAFCIDTGANKSGAVSGAMNMAGNLGSFVSASVFPFLYNPQSGAAAYFLCAAGLSLAAAGIWLTMGPKRDQRPETV